MRIFIGNIGSIIAATDLRRLFSAFGPVEDAVVPRDKFGDSRGFGYIVMASEADALQAISALDKQQFMEQFLSVCKALAEGKLIAPAPKQKN